MDLVAGLIVGLLGLAAGPMVDIRNVVPERYPDVSAVVRVVDAENRAVPDLRRADFNLSEDGRPITDFEVRPSFREGGSLSVVLVIDSSGSMQGAPLDAAKTAARTFIERLGPDDRVAVVTFGDTPRLHAPLGPAVQVAGVDQLVARGETALYDAIDLGIAPLASQPASARALVVLSDGGDTVSRLPLDRVLETVTLASIPLHAVAFTSEEFNPEPLRRLADASKGSYREVASADQLAAVYRQIAAELLAEYRITYRSAAPRGAHRLTVAVQTAAVQASSDKDFTVAQLPGPVETVPSTEPSSAAPIVLASLGALLATGLAVLLLLRRARPRAPAVATAVPATAFPGVGPVLEGIGVAIPVSAGLVIGRDTAAGVIVDDPAVSRLHARLDLGPDGVWVEDLGSSNGTLVNGVPITRSLLRPGDILDIGDLRLWLRDAR